MGEDRRSPRLHSDSPALVVETEWLAARLGDPGIRIVDCRYHDDEPTAREAYLTGHIPGAVHIYWPRDLALGSGPVPNLLPTAEQATSTFGSLGIGDDTTVVAYDAEGGHHAGRLWLVLAFYGHSKVSLLDGGIPKWIREGRPTEAGEARPAPATFNAGPPQGQLRVRAAEIVERLQDPRFVLTDVRRRTEYTGEEARAARGGRIPGARHIPWQRLQNEDGTLRSPEEIREIHEQEGISPEDEVVTYCQAGVRAAFSAFALVHAGFRDVRVYDGSWAEWGNDPNLPIEKG